MLTVITSEKRNTILAKDISLTSHFVFFKDAYNEICVLIRTREKNTNEVYRWRYSYSGECLIDSYCTIYLAIQECRYTVRAIPLEDI